MNSIFASLSVYRAYIIMAAIVAVLACEFVYVRDVYTQQGEARYNELHAQYDALAAEMKIELQNKELALANANQELERKNADSKRKIDEANRRYVDLAKSRGLWDPGTTPMRTPNGVPNSGSTAGAEGSKCDRELSAEAGGFLLTITKEADELKADYATCMSWVSKTREILKQKSTPSVQR